MENWTGYNVYCNYSLTSLAPAARDIKKAIVNPATTIQIRSQLYSGWETGAACKMWSKMLSVTDDIFLFSRVRFVLSYSVGKKMIHRRVVTDWYSYWLFVFRSARAVNWKHRRNITLFYLPNSSQRKVIFVLSDDPHACMMVVFCCQRMPAG